MNEFGQEFWVRGDVMVPDWDEDSFFSAKVYDCGGAQHSRLPVGGRVVETCEVPTPGRTFPARAAPPEDAYLVIAVYTENGPDSRTDGDGRDYDVRQRPADGATLAFRATYVSGEPFIELGPA